MEFNRPNYLGHFFSADKVYEAIEFAADHTGLRQANYIWKKRGQYTDAQSQRIYQLNREVLESSGEDWRLAKQRRKN